MTAVSPPPYTKIWLQLEPNKKIGKLVKHNLAQWLTEKLVDIKSVDKKTVRYLKKESDGEWDEILTLKTIKSLPISRQSLKLKLRRGEEDFLLSAPQFKYTDQDMFGVNAEVETALELFRNEQSTEDERAMDSYQLITYLAYVAIAQHCLYDLSGVFTQSKRGDIKTLIGQEEWTWLLAIESLSFNQTHHAAKMYLGRLCHAITQFETAVKGVHPNNQLLLQMGQLRKAIIDHIAMHKKPKPDDDEWRKEACESVLNVVKMLKSNTFGRLLKFHPTQSIMAQLGIKNRGIQPGTTEHAILEKAFREQFSFCFSVHKPIPNDNNKGHLSTTSVRTTLLAESIKSELTSLDYSGGYDEEIQTSKHYAAATKEDQKATVNAIREAIEEAKENLSTPSIENMLHCLVYSPSHFNKKNADFSRNVGAKDLMVFKIKTLETQMTGNIDGESKLIQVLDSAKIDISKAHSELTNCISNLQLANKTAQDILKDSLRRSSRSSSNSTSISTKIETGRGKMKKSFEEQIDVMKVSSESTDKKLKVLSQHLYQAISDFRETVELQDNLASIRSSSESAALMIGLGEAGENILRATMVKLLNNHTDRRCKNLLYGMNINQKSIEEYKREGVPEGFDFAWEDKPDTEDKHLDAKQKLLREFDNANLLAINMGPELEEKIKNTPYNYIFGTQPEAPTGAQKRHRQPSTNSLLIDLGKNGCGGKMGLGRANITDAMDAVKNALTQKINNQRITQVCLVHSFGGGSGSGMILPLLSAIKTLLPAAIVWVFSAGDTKEGNSSQINQNVSYITSDVLQSHYNALHHEPQTIEEKDWKIFKSNLQENQDTLEELWTQIAQCYEIFSNSDEVLAEQRQEIHAEMLQKESIFTQMGFTIPDQTDQNNSEIRNLKMLPIGKASIFTTFVQNSMNYESGLDNFKQWMKYSEDSGSIVFKRHKEFRNIFSDDSKKDDDIDEAYFKTNYSHFRAFASGAGRDKDTPIEQAMAIFKQEESNSRDPANLQTLTFAAMDYKFQEGTEIRSPGELKSKILQYARTMSDYHYQIYDMYEKVKLNLVAVEDKKIKHVILSNAHFDTAFTALDKKGAGELYEVYNSTMVDLFLNIVHSLVANEDEEHEGHIIAKTNETMDMNDMSMRTRPSISASVLSLNNATPLSKNVRYTVDQEAHYVGKAGYKLFENLFSNRKSPLYTKPDDNVAIDVQLPPIDLLMAFYSYYLAEQNGLRRFNPWDVIENLPESANKHPLFNNDNSGYYEAYIKSLDEHERTELIDIEGITEEVYHSMLCWIRLMPPEIYDYIYQTDKGEFEKITSEWRQDHKNFFHPKSNEEPLFPETRKNRIANMLNQSKLRKGDDRDNMLSILEKFKIIDESHLACFPSALIYDYAPNILIEEKRSNQWMLKIEYKHFQPFEMDNDEIWNKILNKNPPPLPALAVDDQDSPFHEGKSTHKKLKNLSSNQYHDLRFSILKSPGKPHSYLRIPNLKQGDSNPTPFVTVSKKFLKQFTIIKHSVVAEYPEFGDTTLLEKLILHSSDTLDESGTRKPHEAPTFRTAQEDFLVYGSPKRMTKEETPLTITLRTMLIGNLAKEGRLGALYGVNVPLRNEDVFVKCQQEKMIFDARFTMSEFESMFQKRLNIMSDFKDNVPGEDLENGILAEMFRVADDFVFKNKVNPVKEFFDALYSQFGTKRDSMFEAIDKPNFSKSEWSEACMQVARLSSNLATLVFNLKRQSDYKLGQLNSGSGVSYEYNGTVDALRSTSDDYLALVNTSSDIHIGGIQNAINFYNGEYLQGKVRGKPFIFTLDTGPVANITLVSQQAAVTTISERFQELMTDLEKGKFASLNEPLVHPHSFVRNILWMSTFQETWLFNPTKAYQNCLKIPEEVIKNIIGRPDLIEQHARAIMTGGDLGGIPFPHKDRAMFDSVKWTHQELNKNNEGYQKRMRGQLHIVDMILINYIKAAKAEKLDDVDKDMSVDDLIMKGTSETQGVYPPTRYEELFQKRRVGGFKFHENSDDGNDEDEDDEDGWGPVKEKTAEAWLTALKAWCEYAEEKFEEPETNEDQDQMDTNAISQQNPSESEPNDETPYDIWDDAQ